MAVPGTPDMFGCALQRRSHFRRRRATERDDQSRVFEVQRPGRRAGYPRQDELVMIQPTRGDGQGRVGDGLLDEWRPVGRQEAHAFRRQQDMTRRPCSGQTVAKTERIGSRFHEYRDLSARTLKTTANAAAGEENAAAYPMGTLRIFSSREQSWQAFSASTIQTIRRSG
jgi:hypothetical protein